MFHSARSPTRRATWAWAGLAALVAVVAALVAARWDLVAPSSALAIEIVREMFVAYWPVILGIVAVTGAAGWILGGRHTAG